MAGIKHKSSGVQSHNALGISKRCHVFLCHIFRKVCEAKPDIGHSKTLVLAVKAMNDSAGRHGLVPTLLIFGVMPKSQTSRLSSWSRFTECLRYILPAKMVSVVENESLKTEILTNVPSAAMKDTRVRSNVLVCRENLENMWIGPFKVLESDGNLVLVDFKGLPTQFSVDKVKLHCKPSPDDLDKTGLFPQLDMSSRDSQVNDLKERSTSDEIIDEVKDVIEGLRDRELESKTLSAI